MLADQVKLGVVVGLRLAAKLEAGMGSALKVPNLVGDTGGFNMMVAGLELLFSQDELGMYLIELCVELALGVVEVLVLLNLGDVPPIVELRDC